MKNFIEKDRQLGIDLVVGLLKYWPITCPAKEVVYIGEVEEILELVTAEAEKRFNEFGPKLLTQLVRTSQNMHYQAAERALLLLNSEVVLKLLKNNPNAFATVVKGLMGANRGANAHWNSTVNTIPANFDLVECRIRKQKKYLPRPKRVISVKHSGPSVTVITESELGTMRILSKS